jgi:hypothetical protein
MLGTGAIVIESVILPAYYPSDLGRGVIERNSKVIRSIISHGKVEHLRRIVNSIGINSPDGYLVSCPLEQAA